MTKAKETIKKHIPSFLRTIFFRIYIEFLYLFRYGKILRKNQELKDRYNGKRCFLIGNGSSLNEMDLKKLKNEYTFVFNFFYLHKDFHEIRPKFYSIFEPLPNLIGGGVNPDEFFRKAENALKDMKYPEFKMFFSIKARDYLEKNKFFLDKEKYYLMADRSIPKTFLISDDISRYHSFSDASIYTAICMAVYMGFKEIYLIGCDYDLILRRDVKHFYDNALMGGEVRRKNASNLVLAEDLVDYLKAMETIRNHFKNRDVKIFNAGIGGFTDTFPRVEYESLFR